MNVIEIGFEQISDVRWYWTLYLASYGVRVYNGFNYLLQLENILKST